MKVGRGREKRRVRGSEGGHRNPGRLINIQKHPQTDTQSHRQTHTQTQSFN
jgi:hypothetical protein